MKAWRGRCNGEYNHGCWSILWADWKGDGRRHTVTARLVRAIYASALPRQVAPTSRAMTTNVAATPGGAQTKRHGDFPVLGALVDGVALTTRVMSSL
jgi:hypothetical protein